MNIGPEGAKGGKWNQALAVGRANKTCEYRPKGAEGEKKVKSGSGSEQGKEEI